MMSIYKDRDGDIFLNIHGEWYTQWKEDDYKKVVKSYHTWDREVEMEILELIHSVESTEEVVDCQPEQSPCEEREYKVGDTFLVTHSSTFSEGSIIRLAKDDKSSSPLFELVEGDTQFNCGEGGAPGAFIYLGFITPYEEPQEELVDLSPKAAEGVIYVDEDGDCFIKVEGLWFRRNTGEETFWRSAVQWDYEVRCGELVRATSEGEPQTVPQVVEGQIYIMENSKNRRMKLGDVWYVQFEVGPFKESRFDWDYEVETGCLFPEA